MNKKIEKVERFIEGIPTLIELATDLEVPERNRFEFEDNKYCWIIRTPKPTPEPTVYEYKAFTKKIEHPKRARPIYKDYEILEFMEELTSTEIENLEFELGKMILKVESEVMER